MEYIVNLSPEINARNRNGDTPLSLAVQRNIRKAGEFLLGRGADIFSANNDNYSPLRMVLEDTRNTRSWFLTSQVIKATDGSGNTPLHYAAEWAQPDAVMLLVEKGAEAIALASCISKGVPLNFPCPNYEQMARAIKAKVDVPLLDHTH